MALYHKDVFLPPVARTLHFSTMLRYSAHARKAAQDDHVTLPAVFSTENATLIEAEVNGRKVSKMVYRQPYNSRSDLLLVLNPDGFVRTVWTNSRTDSHRTLNRGKYATT